MPEVPEKGRTAYQLMKSRPANAKLVPMGETVLFKIPKTQQRVGKFEDRWDVGCWVGFIIRTGEHLVATNRGVFRVSTVRRRTPDKRWSATLIKSMTGTPADPVPGSGNRRIPAFAKKHVDESSEKAVFTPMPEVDIEPRRAKIQKVDVEEHGPSERCPGCRAVQLGKPKAPHTDNCRKRFESILSQSEKGKKRFDAATQRRLDAITKKACEMQEEIEKKEANADSTGPTPEAGGPGGGAASGSGQSSSERRADIDAQNRRSLDEAMEASVQQQSGGSRDGGTVAAAQADDRGSKRHGDSLDDSARLQPQQSDSRGAKRIGDELDDSERFRDLSVIEAHPGPVQRPEQVSMGELEWRNIGSGVFAKTFIGASRLRTTSKGGPRLEDVHRRVVRSLSTGKVIDDCIIEDTPDEVLNRYLRQPDDLRVELTMRGALKMFEDKNADISEIYSQPRIAQEAALRRHGGMVLRPGWSLDLTREDPATGKAWDLSRREVRERVRQLVRDTRPFIVIGSPPCTMFCGLQNLRNGKRDEDLFQKKLEDAKKHVRFCVEIYRMQIASGRFFLHEHPNSASSWAMPEVVGLAMLAGVDTAVCDMCAYGMVAEDKEGVAPAKKRTRLMSNAPEVLKRTGKQCSNQESGATLDSPLTRRLPKLRAPKEEHRHVSLEWQS